MSTNCYYSIEVSLSNWDTSILTAEELSATTSDLLGKNLSTIYENANSELEYLAQKVTSASGTDAINQAQITYQEASAEYQNLETTVSSEVQSAEQTSSGLATDQQNAMQFGQSIAQMESQVSQWLGKA